MPVHATRLAAATLLATLAACAVHEAAPAFRRAIVFDDRGISVPLPPPSLVDAEVEGGTEGKDPLAAGTRVHVLDVEGGDTAEAEVDPTSGRFTATVQIDPGAHCLEVWLEAPDGRTSDHTFVHAQIVDDTVITVEGC